MIDLSSIDVLDLMWHLGVRNAHPASGCAECNFSCPFEGHSHGDESPSAYMNMETTAWFCWGCKRKGRSAVQFVAQVQGVSEEQAKRYLRELYGIEFDEPISGSMVAELDARWAPKPDLPVAPRPSESWLRTLEVDWPRQELKHEDWSDYLYGRGFLAPTLEHWEVGYDYVSQRITFPVRDLDCELIGIKARSHDGREPKYLVMGDRDGSVRYGFVPHEPTEVVYGLHRRRDCRHVVLFEGELNAWAASQVGVVRPCAIGMSYLSPRHVELVLREAEMVTLFFDPDEAGAQATAQAVRAFEQHVPTYVVQGHHRDAAYSLEHGDGSTIVELIESAPSSLLLGNIS